MERSCRRKGKRTTIYYCHPYSSFEKGSTEKQNGMIRRRHPKGSDFAKVSARSLRDTEEWLNNYPRKMFGFHSSEEIFSTIFPEAAALLLSRK
jgi:IS30 family transposase